MVAPVLVAAVAAVLAPARVVFVDATRGTVLRTVSLPGEGAAIFAAPDGRTLVPLRGEDATAVVSPSGAVETWRGRLFPLFPSEGDRMAVVLPGLLAVLSYPERLPLVRVPLDGVGGALRAACSEDGRLVVLIPAGAGARTLLVVAVAEGGTARSAALAGEATSLALMPDGAVAVTASGATLAAVVVGEPQARPAIDAGGEVRSLCTVPGDREVLAGLAVGAAGEVLGVRVDRKARQPLSERFRTRLPAPVSALAASGDEVVAVSGETLVLLRKGRRIAGQLPLPGARDVAFLPLVARTTLPQWSDAPGR